MGHTWTLDPLASWCLLIATEKSTKLIPLLESSKKEYVTTIRFDARTESYDTETPLIAVNTKNFSWKTDSEIIDFLLRQNDQIPPKYSAIHIDGKRSYEIARKWKECLLKKRPIQVHEVEIIKKWDFQIQMRIKVSSGCYIRSFWPLLWEFFGVDWWYLTELRRISIDGENFHINLSDSSNIDDPKPILSSILFHTIPTYVWSDTLMEEIVNWRKISENLLPDWIEEGSTFFLTNVSNSYTSLCKKEGIEVKILKNNVA